MVRGRHLGRTNSAAASFVTASLWICLRRVGGTESAVGTIRRGRCPSLAGCRMKRCSTRGSNMTRIHTSGPGPTALLEAVAICSLLLLLQQGCDPAQTDSVEVRDAGGNTADGEATGGSWRDGAAGLAKGSVSSGICGARDCTSSRDNDCNGKADNTELDLCRCPVGDAPRSCITGLSGICAAGSQPCVLSDDKSASDWATTCTPLTPKGTETCANPGTDDDCDGTVDNIPVTSCNIGSGIGACANGGITTCNGTTQVCSPGVPGIGDATAWHDSPTPNGSWDWDCDGVVTEQYPAMSPPILDCTSCQNTTSIAYAESSPACGGSGVVYATGCLNYSFCIQETETWSDVQSCR